MEDFEREIKRFWYVDVEYGKVKYVNGWSCNSPNYWWCPEVGVSAAEGYSLFNSREEAMKRLISELNGKINHYQSLLDKAHYGDDI